MTTSLENLKTPSTIDEASTTIYTALAARGVDVSIWVENTPLRAVIVGLAIIYAAFSALVALIVTSGFLTLSEGDWLTLRAHYVYDVDRIGATKATGLITLTNAGVGVYTKGVGELIVSRRSKTFTNTAPFSLGPSASITVPIAATEAGAGSTSTAGTITNMATPLPGVTCTNEAALVGTDEESDEQLRSRCAAKLGTLSVFGPADAYDFVAKSATRADGSSIGVTRTRAIPDGVGGIDFYVADLDGGLSASPDVDTIDALLRAHVLPEGITLRTHAAGTVPIEYVYELWIPSSVTDDDDTVHGKIASAVIAQLGTKPIGGDRIPPASGKIYKSALETMIGTVYWPPLRCEVSFPFGDVDIGPAAAPAAGTGTPTAIHRVDPA